MTDEPVIVAEHLSKVYRLYQKPQERILDILGVRKGRDFTEHYALDDLSMSIGRGERVGIIGRNGAGKSTLLKIVSGVTTASSGSLRVDGSARALLEIGTGFHPEFTGRDNAKAYLAQLGISGQKANITMDNIVDFAELEEYIDQPLKTYSTGMKVRLMFSTSTVMAPELLILDEVLGVGDAYFSKKSFDRINEMCNEGGTTLLLVSHDIYTTSRICDRMIWLEKGRAVFDGNPKDAIKAYEGSIRQQEEARLRSKSLMALQRAEHESSDPAASALHFEVAVLPDRVQEDAIWFASVRLLRGDSELAALPTTTNDPESASTIEMEASCWGPVAEWQGVSARPMLEFGSPFRKVSGVLAATEPVSDEILDEVSIELKWGAEKETEVMVSCRAGERLVLQQPVPVGGNGWESRRLSFAAPIVSPALSTGRSALFGTGVIRLRDVHLSDGEGNQSFSFWHGEEFRLSVGYDIRDPSLDENCDIVIAILRGGVETACRIFTRSLEFSYARSQTGTVEMVLPKLMLGIGSYSLTVMIAREGYYDQQGHAFYSINPDVHVCIRDMVDFSVRATGVLAEGTAWVAEAEWELLSNVVDQQNTCRDRPQDPDGGV